VNERADRDVDELADGLEQQADRLKRRSDEVAEHIDDARDQWDRKRNDDAVPGAKPPFDTETDFQESDNPARGPGGPAG
jgi:hypothetical protein